MDSITLPPDDHTGWDKLWTAIQTYNDSERKNHATMMAAIGEMESRIFATEVGLRFTGCGAQMEKLVEVAFKFHYGANPKPTVDQCCGWLIGEWPELVGAN